MSNIGGKGNNERGIYKHTRTRSAKLLETSGRSSIIGIENILLVKTAKPHKNVESFLLETVLMLNKQ